MPIGFLAIFECEWSHSSFMTIETKYSLAKFLVTHNFYGNHDLIPALCSPHRIAILHSNVTEASMKVVCLLTFYQRICLPRCLSKNYMMQFIDMTFCIEQVRTESVALFCGHTLNIIHYRRTILVYKNTLLNFWYHRNLKAVKLLHVMLSLFFVTCCFVCVISGIHYEVAENRALLGYYAASTHCIIIQKSTVLLLLCTFECNLL